MEKDLPEYNDHVGGYSIGKKDGTTIATKDTTDGGLFVGKSHAEDGGIKTINIETNEPLLVEGGEVIVNKRVLALDEEFVCTGTPKDITSKINEMEGGVSWSDKGSCRIVKKAANGIDIESDIEINRAIDGIGVQYFKDGNIHVVTADNEDQAELIEDAINDYREGFIEKEELENTLQSYGSDTIIQPADIEVVGGIKHIKSDFYQGWVPLYNQEPIQIAENGKTINDKVSFENIGNGTWAFEYNDNGIKASGIVKKNEKIGEFDYVIEETHETFDKNNRVLTSGIYREVGSAFSNPETRFMKANKKAAWGWNILGKTGEKSHEKDNVKDVNSKLIDLDVKWEALRDEYRHGHFTTEEYFENKKELLAEYEPYIARALQLGVAVNQGILWGVKKAERGTEVNPVNPKPSDVRPGMFKVFSETNASYPVWTGDIYDIKKYISESSDLDSENWEESLEKLGLSFSEIPFQEIPMAADGYFRSQDKEKRPSPSISAKIFPAGYRMEGNDGNIWEISVATNGVHRWVRSHKAADGTEIVNRVEEVSKYISIGFGVPKDYKPAAWAKAKRYMDELVELGYVTKNDLGRGKGKYWTNDKSDAISTNLSELTTKLAEILIDSGKIKAEDGVDISSEKDGKVLIIEAYDTNEKGDDKEQLWLYLGYPNAQFKVVYTVTDTEYVKEDVLSEEGTEFIAERLEDVVFTDEDGNESKFTSEQEASAMEDITALFKKYIQGKSWDDKPSSVKMNADEILKAANGVIISSSCGCQHKAENGAKIDENTDNNSHRYDWIKSEAYGVTSNGIPFTEEIYSSRGASFVLFPITDKQSTSEEISKAKAEIRDQRDAVSIKVAGDSELDDLYKSAYFRDARLKPLRWYQIEQDERLIRAERKKGTTPTEFVDQFVIPFVAETEKKYRKKFGDKIETYSDGGPTVYVFSKNRNPKNEPLKVGDYNLVYQKWSKIMGGNGVSGTIRTVPENYYVATISPKGEISFENLEANTRDIDQKEVTMQWYSGNIVEYFSSPYDKGKSDWKAENGSFISGNKSEAEMRAIYVEAFGQEFDSPLRKQAPLPIEMAYKVALNKLLAGKRVEIIEMVEDPKPVPSGTMGTIIGIDGIGQIMVKSDNGSSLSLIPGLDKYKIHGLDKDYFADGGPINRDKVAQIMHEFKEGKLHDSHGKLVTKRSQAIAIALSMASRMAADGTEIGVDWSRIEQNEREFEAAMQHLGIPKKDWEKYRNDFAANGKRVKEIVITKMSDIENIEDKINDGKVTYRGLGMGKLSDDFYKLAGENGKRITVDGKEYFVTDSDYRQYEWDEQKGAWRNRIKFNAPHRKFDNGGGVVNENDDMELWFSPGGELVTYRPKGSALHMFEDFLTQKIGARNLEVTECNDHEYVYQIIGNMDRVNQKMEELKGELKGFEIETYGAQKRLHIPTEVVNQVVLSMRYPLMTPYAEGGPIKDWTNNIGVTNEEMKWIDQIEKEHIEEDIVWLFYEKFSSPEEAEKAKSKSDIKKYDTKVIEHNGKYWLFFKMNFGLEAFEKVAAANGIKIKPSEGYTVLIPFMNEILNKFNLKAELTSAVLLDVITRSYERLIIDIPLLSEESGIEKVEKEIKEIAKKHSVNLVRSNDPNILVYKAVNKSADGSMIEEEEVDEMTEEFTGDDIEKHGTVFVSEWNKYNDLYKDRIKYAEYEIPEAVAVFEGKNQYSRKFFKMYGTIDHIKKAFEYIDFSKKIAESLSDEKNEYPELTRDKDLKVYALNRASYLDGYKAYANGGTIGAEHEAWVDQHLTEYGFDVNQLTQEQKSLILQPTEAPEVYSADGEIRSGEAMSIWLKKLAKTLKSADIKKAVRANFASDGKSITVYHEVRPTGEFLSSQILRNAVRIGAITVEQANSNSSIRSVAREVADEHRNDEEIGSSDMTFILKEFLDGIGLETYFGGDTGSSLQFKGEVKMKNGGTVYPYMNIGVIEPKPETIFSRWHPPVEVYKYANKIWAGAKREKRVDILKKYVPEFKNLDLTTKGKPGSAVPDMNWRNLAWSWQREIATGLHNSNFEDKMSNGGGISYADEQVIIDLGQMIDSKVYRAFFKYKGDKAELSKVIKSVGRLMKKEDEDEESIKNSKQYHKLLELLGIKQAENGELIDIVDEAKKRFPNTLKNLGDNYTVSLSAEPNPDFDEDSLEGSINIPEKLVPVKSISEARDKVMQFISENDLGSGNWAGGQIFENGIPVAFISYNGKVWEGKIGNTDYKEFKY